MNELSIWHYLLLSAIAIIFVATAAFTYRSESRNSILGSVSVILFFVGAFSWYGIDQSVYEVKLLKMESHRLVPTEKMVINGILKNTGSYTIAKVTATVKIKNEMSANAEKAAQFAQPTAFAELFEGDDPNFKVQNITTSHVVAENLPSGAVKSFRIIQEVPPYFQNSSFKITLSTN